MLNHPCNPVVRFLQVMFAWKPLKWLCGYIWKLDVFLRFLGSKLAPIRKRFSFRHGPGLGLRILIAT